MKKYILLVLCSFILTSCGNSQKVVTNIGEEPSTEQEATLNKQEENQTTSIWDSTMSCIQSWTVSVPELDTYSVTTCMSTTTLDQDKFKILCELWSQLEWADIAVTYVKECPKPYYGICRNGAPEQSIKAMWGNWS